jgi:signal transduction histidine kinase
VIALTRIARGRIDAKGLSHWWDRDQVLTVAVVVILESDALTSAHRRGALLLNMLVVGVMGAAAGWRRRAPLASLAAVGIGAMALSRGLTTVPTHYATLTGLYCVLFPTYAVAAWATRNRAIIGLGIWGIIVVGVVWIGHGSSGGVGPAVGTALVAWGAGRVMRSERALAHTLEGQLAVLETEKVDTARLAEARERMRIANELHAVVAQSLVEMVREAESVQGDLDEDEELIDLALSSVEDKGRGALVEMRRILGVLRRADDMKALEPQPGVNQVRALIQRNQAGGLPVQFSLSGDPDALPVAVDLSIYRILEEGLDCARAGKATAVNVSLSLERNRIELFIDVAGSSVGTWPTSAMRARISLCGGQLESDSSTDNLRHLRVWIPTSVREGPS